MQRRPDPSDRRVKLVCMTEKASCIMEEVDKVGHRLREDMVADLAESERDRLVSTLSTIKSRLIRLLEVQ